MSSKPTVLLIGELTHTNKEWQSLGEKYSLIEYLSGTRKDFISNLKSGDYNSVIGLYRSNASVPLTGPFDSELVSLLPPSLRFICHNGAGYDNIDVPSCTKRQISISSTPVAVDNATADTAMFLMLGALRQAQIPLSALRAGQWRGATPIGHDPQGKVLGILGMGGIGRALAKRARAFGMEIQYHNRRRLSPELEEGATYVSFETLLESSDVLSLNLSLNASTRHIISAPQLSAMKKGVVIVNTARGALIKESDLVDALESGHVSSVGLDVFENEPEIHPGLVKNQNAFLLPHVGTNTVETQRDMELLVLKNLENAVDGKGLLTRIAEQKGIKEDWARDETETGTKQVNGHL